MTISGDTTVTVNPTPSTTNFEYSQYKYLKIPAAAVDIGGNYNFKYAIFSPTINYI